MDYEKNEPVRRRRRKRKPPYGLYITICILGIGILVLGFAYLSELARNGHLPGLGGKLFLMGEEEQAAEETFAPEEDEAFADAYFLRLFSGSLPLPGIPRGQEHKLGRSGVLCS